MKPTSQTDTITTLLKDQTPESIAKVIQTTYPQLHRIAVGACRKERPSASVQPTALVSELCIRLLQSPQNFKNRAYFFRSVSTAMQRILVEHARQHNTKKRGGDWQRVDFHYAEKLGFEGPQQLLDFDAALHRLGAIKPQLLQVVELRVFGRLTSPEVAEILNIGESTVRARYARARAWLRHALTE